MEFRILGSLEVVENGRPVPIRAGNDRALLALLLLHSNEVMSNDLLVEELWAQQAPPSAAKIVQNAVLRLRRALGDGRLETAEHGYRLRVDPDELDVARFERLLADDGAREALSLWRGRPLPELADYAFASDAARRLEELRLVALERRFDTDLAARRGPALVAELERLAAEHPFRERFHAQLMRALYADGRQAEALEAYQRARRSLAEELGLEPGPELHELECAILNHDPELEVLRPPEPIWSRRRRPWLLLAAALVLGGAALGAYFATRGGAAIVLRPNSVVVLDPDSARTIADIPVGAFPGAIAVGPSGVWVVNTVDETVTRIDPKHLAVAKTYGVGGAAVDIALDDHGGAWVVTGFDNTLVHIDARRGVGPVFSLPSTPSGAYSVAVAPESVYVGANMVLAVDPRTGAMRHAPGGCCLASDLAYGYGALWVATRGEGVAKLGAVSLRVVTSQRIGQQEQRLALGYGTVWAAGTTFVGARPTVVWELDPLTGLPKAADRVGFDRHRFTQWNVAIAVGAGAVWVAPANSRELVRLDPETGGYRRIPLSRKPAGIAVGLGRVWVTVR